MIVGVDGYPLSGRRTGIGRYTAELLMAAARVAPEVTFDAVLFGHHPEGPPQVEDLVAAGVAVHWPPTWRSLCFRGGLKARLPVPLSVLLPRSNVFLYTNYRWYPGAGRPTMTFLYDLGYLHHPDLVHPRYLDELRRAAAIAVARSDRIGVISRTMADELAEAYPGAADRTVVIRPGAPVAGPPSHDAQRLATLGLSPGFLLHVGTVEPRKNLVTLIRAWDALAPDLRERHPLVLVGNQGWSDGPILDAIARSGVRYLNFVGEADLEVLYRQAVLLVCPSVYEGFGLPLLEAMSHDLAVACSDIPVFREAAGEAAAFFDPHSGATITEVVTDLLRDEQRRVALVAAGRVRLGGYSWVASGRELVGALRALSPSA